VVFFVHNFGASGSPAIAKGWRPMLTESNDMQITLKLF